MNRVNVDTDQIIPKQFLKKIGRTGFGEFLFYDWRYIDGKAPNPDFELNLPVNKGAEILVAGDNFGCGSSREHAPWALLEYGIRSVISTSFADIFFNNCYKNGMLPIRVSEDFLALLMGELEEKPGSNLKIDLAAQTVTSVKGKVFKFEVDSFRKDFLLKGMDDIAWTLQFENMITAFEEKQKISSPWLWR